MKKPLPKTPKSWNESAAQARTWINHPEGVYIYGRASKRDNSDEATSVATQLRYVTMMVGNRGGYIIGNFIDEGIAGNTPPLSRPGLAAAVRATASDGRPIVVSEISRISRVSDVSTLGTFEPVS